MGACARTREDPELYDAFDPSEEPVKEIAIRLTKYIYATRSPRPAAPFPIIRNIMTGLLNAGWGEIQIQEASERVMCYSFASFELELHRALGRVHQQIRPQVVDKRELPRPKALSRCVEHGGFLGIDCHCETVENLAEDLY